MEWNASDAVGSASIEISVDDGAWTNMTGQVSTTLYSLTDGRHIVVLRATDLIGRTATAWSNFTMDTAPLTASMKVAEDVPCDGPVVIVFSKAVNVTTLQWSAPLTGTISWQGNDLIIQPSSRLEPGLEYGIAVSINDIYGAGSGPLELTFRTTDQGIISGVILDPTGNPVVGALVTTPDGSSVLTDENGSFSLNLPSGPVQLEVHKDSYSDLSWDVDVVPGEEGSIGSRQLSTSGNTGQFILPLAAIASTIVIALVLIVVARRRR